MLHSGRLAIWQIVGVALMLAMLAAATTSTVLETPIISMSACAAILVFGLPHGTFDVALIRRSHDDERVVAIVALYLGLAAAMYALWHYAPALALTLFFALAIVHFAEDWADVLPPFFGHGIAASLLTAPALMHRRQLEQLFALLIGSESSALLAAVAILVAPVTLTIAVAAIIVLWNDKHRNNAVVTGLALLTMAALPPLVGFALFFCLLHSPTQFAAAQRVLDWQRMAQWARVVVPLTIAALAIAATIFVTVPIASISGATIATAFMTLAVLTLPHMAVPLIVDRINRIYVRNAV